MHRNALDSSELMHRILSDTYRLHLPLKLICVVFDYLLATHFRVVLLCYFIFLFLFFDEDARKSDATPAN